MESDKACPICYLDFNTKENAPRVLSCGHTLCPKCLTKILNDNKSRKCPFDKMAFLPSQTSLESFPVNFAFRDVLEQRTNKTCKVHPDEVIELFCLTDETKICFECTQEKHQGHKVKKIKTLKAQGAKVKQDLQETLLSFTNYEQEKAEDVEQIKKVFIKNIDEQTKEIISIIVEKQFEWVQQVNNIFDADKMHDTESLFESRQQIDQTVQNITNAFQDENGDLMIISKESDPHDRMVVRKQTQFLKEKSLRVQSKVLEIQNSLKESLVNSQIAINSLQLPIHDILEEMYPMQEDKEKLSEEELAKRQKKLASLKFMSHFDFEIDSSGYLNISFSHAQPKEIEINLADFQEIETVDIQSIRCDMLKNEPHPDALSYIFHGLKKLENLIVSFDHQNFSNESLLWLGKKVQGHFHHLKRVHLSLRECKFNDESMSILCNMVFSKMINLDLICFGFSRCQITDADLKILTKAIEPVQKKLKAFGLELDYNKITDDGVNQVFETVRSMEGLKNLVLVLFGSNMMSESLKTLGENILPSLKCLEELILDLRCKVLSDEIFCAVLRNLPDLKSLILCLEEAPLTNQSAEMFIRETLPRLKSLESLEFCTRKTKISSEYLQKIQDVCVSLRKKKESSQNGK